MFAFDIETVPLADALAAPFSRDSVSPPSNYKNPEAIEGFYVKAEATWRASRVKACSLNPRLGRIVAINNAWRVRPDWDDHIHPSDFPEDRRPPAIGPSQRIRTHLDYVPAVNAHGGFVFCGGTMAFTAGYWALEALRPRVLAFLGCDMVYAASGASHFYGRGTPDPLREDPTLQSLEAKSARLMMIAASMGCAVVNLSVAPMNISKS